MELIFEFGGPNEGFLDTYQHIYSQFTTRYPTVTISHVRKGMGHCEHPGGRCGISMMTIINPENNKATVLSFWDRGRDVILGNSWSGWEGLNIVHCIGGLGVSVDRMSHLPIKFTPFLYPLELRKRYVYIERCRHPYIPQQKIQKACFIGNVYSGREVIVNELQKHPLFDIFDVDAGYYEEAYFEQMSKYVLTLSLNGNGELCMRDFESMGLGIPVVRSEVKSAFMQPFVDRQNYIRGSDPALDAWFVYGGRDKEIAEQFISTVETAIHETDMLSTVSRNSVEYFDNYCYPAKIADKFFEVFDLDILR